MFKNHRRNEKMRSGDLRKTVAGCTERRGGRPLTQEKEHNTRMCFSLKPVFTRDKGRLPNFIDEPTTNLDSLNEGNYLKIIERIRQEENGCSGISQSIHNECDRCCI